MKSTNIFANVSSENIRLKRFFKFLKVDFFSKTTRGNLFLSLVCVHSVVAELFIIHLFITPPLLSGIQPMAGGGEVHSSKVHSLYSEHLVPTPILKLVPFQISPFVR